MRYQSFGSGFGLITLCLILSGCSLFSAQHTVPEVSTEPFIKAAIGEACGGIAGIQCADENTYCALKPGACQIPDAMGLCTAIRPICTREYRPVCGCDGAVYATACVAQAAGVNVLKSYSGEDKTCTPA